MPDVVIIGGGLSGLAAACELEQLGVAYTLIEVKNRLGGNIASIRCGDFIFDAGPMYHSLANPAAFAVYLEKIGLPDATFSTDDGLAFRGGTGTLVDALAAKISAPVMKRMAVSTLGQIDTSHFAICLENGLLLDARALVLAAPAQYAERMLYTLVPEISQRLMDYRCETVTHVSAGYVDAYDLPTEPLPDSPVTAVYSLTEPGRVPPGGVILQARLCCPPEELPADPPGHLAALMGWPLSPAAGHISAYQSASSMMRSSPEHIHNIREINRLLPDGVALAGSDYILTSAPPRLDERIEQGITAAHCAVQVLG
jgi:hypothetical protein